MSTAMRRKWPGNLTAAVALAALALGVAFVTYLVGRQSVYGDIRHELVATARTAAALMEPGDIAELIAAGPGGASDAAVRQELLKVRQVNPTMRNVYLLRPVPGTSRFQFLADVDEADPAAFGEILEADTMPDLLAAPQGASADRAITTDRWGRWLSGYAPIVDASGTTLAVLGVDLPAEDVAHKLWVVLFFSVFFGLGFAVTIWTAGSWISDRGTSWLAQEVLRVTRGRVAPLLRTPERAPNSLEALLDYYRNLAEELQEALAREARLYEQTLGALAAAVRTRDLYTGDHSLDVSRLCDQVGLRLGLPEDARHQLRYSAVLHDIGKIAIPDRVLLKPGPLDPDERALMEEHPRLGHDLLAGIEMLRPIAHTVLAHHERWDGQGYPLGLKGEAIPLQARIISVVDALSAMTTDRPYRKARPLAWALAELRKHAGSQFDPAVVQAVEESVASSAEQGA